MTEPLIAYSLSNFREIILGCLERAGARTIVEVGSEYGEFTQELADHARRVGGKLITVDPEPQPEALAFSDRHQEVAHFAFLKQTSLDAIPALDEVDVYIVDGDHNYYTVRNELEAIVAHQRKHGRPVLVFEHDVGWPWGRRDMYYVPERIPAASRQPYSHKGGVSFDHAELVPGGFGDANGFGVALREGGKQNGVRTAIEDFLVEHPELRFEFVPAFFGLGIIYSREAPWADRIADLLRPFADNLLLAKMEKNRARLFSRVLELEHQNSESNVALGGYLQGAHLLEIFSAGDASKFEGIYRSRLSNRVREQEELVAQDAKQFALPGYCVVCNRMTQFVTDRMFANADAKGRWTPAWRERQICSCGYSCRQRSCLHVLTQLPGVSRNSNVYCTDRGPNARLVKAMFPRAIAADAPPSASARLAFADASLDCIVSLDTLEHVPDVRATVRELARSLRPFGWLLMTPTLYFDRATTVDRATQDEKGGITHHQPPIMHPDPMGGAGLLRFHEFGWDLLPMLREAGFASAEVVVYTAPHYGYVGLQYVILAGRGNDKPRDVAEPKRAGGEEKGNGPR